MQLIKNDVQEPNVNVEPKNLFLCFYNVRNLNVISTNRNIYIQLQTKPYS